IGFVAYSPPSTGLGPERAIRCKRSRLRWCSHGHARIPGPAVHAAPSSALLVPERPRRGTGGTRTGAGGDSGAEGGVG
ncbi:MAG: hypothetical protein WAL63_13045, partial [Solirubrobacteraceae bacterium]